MTAHAHHHVHAHARPIGGKLLDRPVLVLLSLFGVAAAVMVYRFVAGIGAVSNMNDGYTWGIWEPINVVVFTGIGAGAYSVGLLCYLLNRGEYHPLVRPAVLLGAIAYLLGGASIVVALGRYWNMYWLAVPAMWNLSSVLLEVAVCVVLYLLVLWIEVLPAVLEGTAAAARGARSERARRFGARLARAMPYIIALAMVPLPPVRAAPRGPRGARQAPPPRRPRPPPLLLRARDGLLRRAAPGGMLEAPRFVPRRDGTTMAL